MGLLDLNTSASGVNGQVPSNVLYFVVMIRPNMLKNVYLMVHVTHTCCHLCITAMVGIMGCDSLPDIAFPKNLLIPNYA